MKDQKQSRNLLRNWGPAGVVVGFSFALVIGSTTLGATASPNVSVPEKSFAASEYDFDLLASNEPAVALPEVIAAQLEPGAYKLETVRLLDQSDSGSTYSALDEQGQLCVITYVSGAEWTAGIGCSSPSEFNESGANIRISGPEGTSEVYLLSDQAAQKLSSRSAKRSASALPLEQTSSNLVTLDPSVSADERVKISESLSDSGVKLEIMPQEISDEIE
ncbi:hypothetical protein ACUWEX_00865 [Okibacterium fritillariae]|uniref:hypothetical protein n=1 Tax=Okibacterium fritillariae TaxID=123320 RepID=UPI0040557933